MVGDENCKIKVGWKEEVSHASSVLVYILPFKAFKIAQVGQPLRGNKTQVSKLVNLKTKPPAPSGNVRQSESYTTLCFSPHLKIQQLFRSLSTMGGLSFSETGITMLATELPGEASFKVWRSLCDSHTKFEFISGRTQSIEGKRVFLLWNH